LPNRTPCTPQKYTSEAWLAELVRRADAGEAIGENWDFEETPETNKDDSNEDQIEVFTELICGAGDKPGSRAAALPGSSYPPITQIAVILSRDSKASRSRSQIVILRKIVEPISNNTTSRFSVTNPTAAVLTYRTTFIW
jgi:hypothetical protein